MKTRTVCYTPIPFLCHAISWNPITLHAAIVLVCKLGKDFHFDFTSWNQFHFEGQPDPQHPKTDFGNKDLQASRIIYFRTQLILCGKLVFLTLGCLSLHAFVNQTLHSSSCQHLINSGNPTQWECSGFFLICKQPIYLATIWVGWDGIRNELKIQGILQF